MLKVRRGEVTKDLGMISPQRESLSKTISASTESVSNRDELLSNISQNDQVVWVCICKLQAILRNCCRE